MNPYEPPQDLTVAAPRPLELELVQLNRFSVYFLSVLFSFAIGTAAITGKFGMFCLLPSVCVAGILLAAGCFRLMARPRDRRQQQRRTIAAASLSGCAFSPFVIAMEWGSVHPWPANDQAYVALTVVRCLLCGSLLGYAIFRGLAFAHGTEKVASVG